MLDISVVILTYNEELHIRRCIENVKNFASHIYLVDYSQEGITSAIEKALNTSREELEAMGHNGRTLIENKYSSQSTADLMLEFYEEVISNTTEH